MKNSRYLAFKLWFVIFAVIGLQSCSEDENTPGTSEDFTQTELQTVLETDKIASTVDTVLAEIFLNDTTAGKSFSSSDDCYSAEFSQTGFVVSFNNCTINGTDDINGNLTITYAAENESSVFTATYADFYVGNLKINGTRNYVLTNAPDQNTDSYNVTSSMTVETEVGTLVTESGTKTFSFNFGDTLGSSTFSLRGNWKVEANGTTYMVETVDDLKGSLTCEHLIGGSMNVDKNGFIINVDFGEGQCDNQATITLPDGESQEVTF